MVSVSRLAAVHGAFWVADRWYRIWWYVWPASLALLISGWIIVDKPGLSGTQESASAGNWAKPVTPAAPIPVRNSPILANWPEKLHNDVLICFSEASDLVPLVDACSRLLNSADLANPQRVVAYNRRGFLLRLKQPARALEDYDAALKIQPNAPIVLTNWAFIYLTRNQNDAALADLNKAIEQFPPTAAGRAHFLRGVAYKQLTDYDKAIAELDENQRIDPDVPDHFVIRGEIEQARKNYDAALGDFDEFSKRAPRDPRGLIGRATVLEVTGRPQEALTALDSALNIDPSNLRATALRDRLRAQQKAVDQLKKRDDPPE
jgi:tetratricopeptide (TPR) repeat protein